MRYHFQSKHVYRKYDIQIFFIFLKKQVCKFQNWPFSSKSCYNKVVSKLFNHDIYSSSKIFKLHKYIEKLQNSRKPFSQVWPYVHRTSTLRGSLTFFFFTLTYNKAPLTIIRIALSKATTIMKSNNFTHYKEPTYPQSFTTSTS